MSVGRLEFGEARIVVFSENIDGELGGRGQFEILQGSLGIGFIGASGAGVFLELAIGVAELPSQSGLPVVDQGLFIDAGDSGAENANCFFEEPVHVSIGIGFDEEPAIDREVGGVAFLGEDVVEVLIDRAVHDDRENGDRLRAVDAPDAMDELLVLVVGEGERGQDEVGAISSSGFSL
jgi:hypothetical protein